MFGLRSYFSALPYLTPRKTILKTQQLFLYMSTLIVFKYLIVYFLIRQCDLQIRDHSGDISLTTMLVILSFSHAQHTYVGIKIFHNCRVLIEQWIRAKYEREEFCHPERQNYLSGYMEGFLMKRGKEDSRYQRRKFVLNENEDTLK